MIRFWQHITLRNRFFWWLGGLIILYTVSFFIPFLYPVAIVAMLFFAALTLVDAALLFIVKQPLSVSRRLPQVMSLHDENEVHLHITGRFPAGLRLRIIDELPQQLQKRDLELQYRLPARTSRELTYHLRPLERGAYHFGKVHIFISYLFGLAERKVSIDLEDMVKVYPSVMQMKKFELYTIRRIAHFQGMKKMRRIGHSYEFDQIKQYVPGDDVRSLNWKATGRSASLMVNHYEDEKAQQVYCLIDKSRTMKTPFDGLSLMDYAINTSLVISNIAIRKEDKAGIITFASKVNTVLRADRHAGQMRKILELLYNEKAIPEESSFEHLYYQVRRHVHVRSLLFLYTNFESYYAIERALSVLRKLNKLHLLVVVFFENEEINRYGDQDAGNTESVYLTTFAKRFTLEKQLIMQELNKYGIQTIITSPSDLTIHTINKYLELKSRGLA